MKRAGSTRGFIGLSPLLLFMDYEALKISAWPEAAPYADRSPFYISRMYCTDYQGKPRTDSKQEMLLACPPSPSHYIALTELRWWRWWLGTRCSIYPGQQGEPRANEGGSGGGPTGLTLLLCGTPQGLDLVTTFNAASFCVAFFSSLLYMEKLTHLVNVITHNNNSNNNDHDDDDDS